MRVLGLDLGAKRIGLAISDADGSIAFPLGTLAHKGQVADLEALRELIVEREVEQVVVGLPVHMDGRVGPEARRAEAFARKLALVTGLRVDTIDERWTTVEAERSLLATGNRGKKRKEKVDSVAASILLRTYLDRERAAATIPSAEGDNE